jgi:transcriptional regulator with XRE-family HTH domain
MKGSSGSNEANPLHRMLGTFLRLERTRLGYSTGDVASRLRLTDTYYRLVEAGRAAINQSLVFKLIEVFAGADVPSYDVRAINFNRLAIFLVGAHWVGAEMASRGEDQLSPGKHALEVLATLVGEFQVFYEQIKGYFELADEGQKRFLDEVAAPEVDAFLRSEFYSTPQREFLQADDLPTLNIDIVLELKRSLTGRSFVHSQAIAANWETERGAQFREFTGLFTRPELILNQGNLDLFHYEYLALPRFNSGKILFVDSEENEQSIKSNFIRMQNEGRKKRNDPSLLPMSKEEITKLTFLRLNKEASTQYNDLINRLLSNYEAYWSFRLHSGLQVSFVGLHNGNVENIRNLSLRDSDERTKIFDKLWQIANASH